MRQDGVREAAHNRSAGQSNSAQSMRDLVRRMRIAVPVGMNAGDARHRYEISTRMLAMRACLLSRHNNRLVTESDSTSVASSGDTNRSVPDLESQRQQIRFTQAIFDRLMSFRLRMQQTEIDNIERELNLSTGTSTSNGGASVNSVPSPSPPARNNNQRSVLPSRRRTLSLSQGRSSPYNTNDRNISVFDRVLASVASIGHVDQDYRIRFTESLMNALATRTRHGALSQAHIGDNAHTNSGSRVPRSTNTSEPFSALARDSRISNPRVGSQSGSALSRDQRHSQSEVPNAEQNSSSQSDRS